MTHREQYERRILNGARAYALAQCAGEWRTPRWIFSLLMMGSPELF